MSTVKSKKLQVGTDASASNNFTIYQPATPDGTLRIGVGNADSPTEVGQFNANGYKPAANSIPILWAWMSGSQSMSQATWTKIQINSSTFDTTGDLDATNYRYTPSVAGYYDVKAIVNFDSPPSAYQYIAIYRNGSTYLFLAGNRFSSAQLNDWRLSGSCIVYLNGTTDYIELYAYQQSASTPTVLGGTKVRTLIQAHLIQQA